MVHTPEDKRAVEGEEVVIIHQGAIISGLFISGEVGGTEVKFTIDTGASCTLLSTRIFNLIKEEDRPQLRKSPVRLYGPSGQPLDCLGIATFSIKLEQVELMEEMIVADITDDALLGTDILANRSNEADILLTEGVVKMHGQVIPLLYGSKRKNVRQVTLAVDYEVPPMTEMLLDVFVDREEDTTGEQALLIETSPTMTEKYDLVMASSLVDIADRVTTKVRVMNPFNNSVFLHQNLVMGTAESIEQVSTLLENEDESEQGNNGSIRKISLQGGKEMSEPEMNTDKAVPKHLQPLVDDAIQGKTDAEVSMITNLLVANADVFSASGTDLGRTHLLEHSIDTGVARPIRHKPRPVPRAFVDEEKDAIEKLLEQGTARPSSSPWASPIVFVRKKNGQVRPCVDYRSLNKITTKDAFPIPRTQDCLDTVAGAKLFSSLDITSAYNQVPVREEDIPKTAVVTKHGLFEFETMPFGLCNAPATFQRMMEIALSGLQWSTCLIYLDDVLIFSDTLQQHIQRLEEVLSRIRGACLKLKPAKCHLFKSEVAFLGHILSADGVKPNEENIQKILAWEPPKTAKQVQSFLGMANYYRRFVKDYSHLARPLVELTRKTQKFVWTDKCQAAFETIQKRMTSPPILSHPLHEGMYILDTDASDVAIGAVLSQIQDGTEKVIAYGSKSLSRTQRNYCVTDRELYAVRYFTEFYRCYLLGRKFLVRTDHQALRWLFSLKNPSSRIARWIESFGEFEFEVEHRAGNKHSNADGMSRCSNPWNCQCKNFENLRCGPCKKCLRKTELMSGEPEIDESNEETIRRAGENPHHSWPLKTTRISFRRMQQQDSRISMVYDWVKAGKRPTSGEISALSPEVRHYVLLWDSLFIQDGILCRTFAKKDGTGSYQQVLAPPSVREEILSQLHDSLMSGHLGEKKTRDKVLQRFYWKDIRADVQLWVKRCDVCHKIKAPTKRTRAPLGDMRTGSPWDRLSTDILGPLPESNRGNKYVMVVTDYFTKWVEIFALPDQTAVTCANTLLNEVLARYGCPYDIHTDQGRNYTSQVFTELCRLLGIRKTQTTAYHPSGNGQVERFNRTLMKMVKAYLRDEQRDWDLHLGALAGAYRSTTHETTGFSPNFLMFGRENRLPTEIMYCSPPTEAPTTYCEYVEDVRSKLEKAHEVTREHLGKASSRQKELYDAKSALNKYNVGDLVWYAAQGQNLHLSPKLRPSYTGPVLVVTKFNDLTYELQLNGNGSKKTVHHDKLLPYLGRERPKWIKTAMKSK